MSFDHFIQVRNFNLKTPNWNEVFQDKLNFDRLYRFGTISADDHWILPMIEHSGPRSSTLANDRTLCQWSSSFAHDRQLSHIIVHSMIDHFGSWSNRMIIDHTLNPWSCTFKHDPLLWTTILHWWFWISRNSACEIGISHLEKAEWPTRSLTSKCMQIG